MAAAFSSLWGQKSASHCLIIYSHVLSGNGLSSVGQTRAPGWKTSLLLEVFDFFSFLKKNTGFVFSKHNFSFEMYFSSKRREICMFLVETKIFRVLKEGES